MVKPDTSVLEEPSVDFTIEIYSPTNECLLYREYFNSVDMSNSNGTFTFNIGAGTRSGADPADSSTLLTMMDNSQGNFAGLTCSSGSNYDPNPGDRRLLRLTFDDGSGPVTVSQDFNIQSVPYAQYASSLQGLGPANLVQVNTGTADVSQASLETVFAAPADTTELRSLLDGSSTQYIQSSPGSAVNLNGQILENIAAPDSDDDAVNRGWANDNIAGNDASGIGTLGVGEQNQFLQWDGSAWVMADISASALVDGGNATGSAITVGTNDAQDLVLETNNTARLTVGSNGGVLVDSLGVTGSARVGSQVQLQDGDTNYVSLQSPAAVAADVTFTLPAADGTNNQILATDGAGNFFFKDDDDAAETDPRMLTLTAGEVNQLENIDTNTITNAQWGYLANMGGQPLESFTETDPGLQTLSTAEVDQLENIDTNTITNAQWGYLANMGGQPLESFTELDPGLQTLSTAEVDQLENIDTNTITNAQWGYLANMGGQPLESFTEADTLANVTGRGANTNDDIQLNSQAELRLGDDDNSNYVGLRAPAGMSADQLFTLPAADGTSAQVLATDGSGNFYWKTDAGAAGGLNSGDILDAAAGAVGTPGITFNGDLDTGLYNSAANNLAFSTGGTQRMLIPNDGTINILGNSITATEMGYLSSMTAQPLESESDPGLQTLTSAEVDQLENIDTNTITNAQWGYLANMGGQPLESFTESDPGLQTLSVAEVDQLENIDTNTITNAQWGYLANMGGQPLESESDPGLQTLTTAEVDQLENIDTNTITNAQWGYLANMGGQPLESFTEADTLANVTGRGANTSDDLQLDSQAELRFGDDDNSNYVSLSAPAGMSANAAFVLPNADGTNNQVLATDGSGNFFWKNDAGAGSGLSVGDVIRAADGAVGAPGLTFDNDLDTGLYSSAANNLAFSTGGTQRMLIPNDGTINILGNSITATEMGYLSSMTAQPLESESDPGLQTLTAAEVDQLENIDTNTITNAQWGYLANMGGQPLESESDPGLQTLSAAEVDQLENIDTNTITNAQWGYLANMGGQPLESFTETDPGLQTLTAAEVDQLENIDTNTITNAQWGYLANMGGQPLESFTEADTLANVTGRGANTSDDLQLDSQAEMRFGDDDNSNYISLSAPAGMSANANFVLPSADGTSAQVLATDGSGNFYWKNDAGAGAGLSVGDTLPAADGTVGAPSLTFDNDNDNGLFLSGTNEVGFVSGGTERMILLNDGTIDMLGNNITSTEFGYLSSMTAQPLESESDPGLQTLSAAEVDQLENIDTNTITNTQWGYLANMGGQPLESFTESDPGLQTLSVAEVDQLENIDTNTITNAQWGYLANMGGQPLESESDPGLQTLTTAEVDQLENIDTNTITNAQWGYLANMGGQPLESFTEADTLANVTGRGANTNDDIQLNSQAELRFGDDDNSNYVSLRAPTGMSANTAFVLPAADGTANQILQTDGSGNLSWATSASGADDLGDHILDQNLQTGSFWVSGDGNNEGLFVLGDGKVGIGTNNPLTILHVYDPAGDTQLAIDAPAGAGNESDLYFAKGGTANWEIIMDNNVPNASEEGDLKFIKIGLDSDGTPRLHLPDNNTNLYFAMSGGDVGIGTNSPGGKLDIAGNTRVRADLQLANDANDQYVTLKAPDGATGSVTYILPEADGTANQVLATNASGALFWKNDAGAGSGLSSGDVLDAADGTAALPSLTFSNDLDTGMFSGAANEIHFSTAGTARAAILSDGEFVTGDLKVNTLVGNEAFVVSGNMRASSGGELRLARADNGAHIALSAPSSLSGNYDFVLPIDDGTANQVLQTDGSGNMSWVTPSAGGDDLGDHVVDQRLELNGNWITNDGNANEGISIDNNGLTSVRANVADDALIVRNENAGGWSAVRFEDEAGAQVGTVGHANSGNYMLLNTNSVDMVFQTALGSNERMRILAGGNVGIGTTVPGQILDVSGNARVRADLQLANDANSQAVALKAPDALGTGYTLTLPNDDGTSGQVLQTDGSGALSWVTPSAGGYGDGDEIRAASGTANNDPGITFNSDQDTGIYNSADGRLDFTANGLRNFRVSNSAVVAYEDFTVFNTENTVYAASSTSDAFPDGADVLISQTSGTDGVGAFVLLEADSATGQDNQGAYIGAVSNNSGYTPEVVIGQRTGANAYDERVRIDSSGNVGIGTTAPQSTLTVDGAITNNGVAADDDGTIDFATNNIQYTTNSCSAGINLHNLKSGGSYTFIVQGDSDATACSFNAYSDAGSTGLNVHMPADHGTPTANTDTVYSILVAGSEVYFSWVPGL